MDAVANPSVPLPSDAGSGVKHNAIAVENQWQKATPEPESRQPSPPVSDRMFFYSPLGDGETSVTEFVVKVEVGTACWQVAHRYKEFDSLRQFIVQQEYFNTAIKDFCDSKFPGKMIGLSFRSGALQQRIEVLETAINSQLGMKYTVLSSKQGLEFFLSHLLSNSGILHPGTVNALLSFLQIPEQLYLAKTATAAAAAEATSADNAAAAGSNSPKPGKRLTAFFGGSTEVSKASTTATG